MVHENSTKFVFSRVIPNTLFYTITWHAADADQVTVIPCEYSCGAHLPRQTLPLKSDVNLAYLLPAV